jgi:hydroxymethylpyrimidine/phosphomethylpyrimidine kinase
MTGVQQPTSPPPVPQPQPGVVLTIAGFDPSAGAGIAADLKVFAAHRLYGLAAITALTVQSTQGVRRVEPVSSQTLAETLTCLAEDVSIAGLKIGMLATADNMAVVAAFLRTAAIPRPNIVLDPVLRSSSGRELLDPEGLEQLRSRLLEQVGWITPNRGELNALLGRESESANPGAMNPSAIQSAARELQAAHPGLRIVVTGGDANPPNDFLRTAAGAEHWFPGEWIETSATHGTGCAFSSALLAAMVAGHPEAEAVKAAKDYVQAAMRSAFPLGKGHGPLHHLYAFDAIEKSRPRSTPESPQTSGETHNAHSAPRNDKPHP